MPDELTVRRHPYLAKDLKRLGKKHRSVAQDLVYAERLLSAGQTLPETTPYPGFGQRKVFKTRVINTSIASGKSKGYRLIYELVAAEDDNNIELVLLYDHTTHTDESEVWREIRVRLGL